MVHPPGYRFVHDLPNKPLTGMANLQDLENKGDVLQDLENAGVIVSLELLGRHKPEAGGFCLYLSLIIRGVSSGT